MLNEGKERAARESSNDQSTDREISTPGLSAGEEASQPSRDTALNALRERILQSDERDLLFIEKQFDLAGALELRKLIPIRHIAEPLALTGERFAYFSPHQYEAAGAPYGSHGPFCLRESVVARLIQAQDALDRELPGARLKLFDGFRPRSVQIYMREFEHRRYASELGFDPNNLSEDQSAAAWRMVDAVWARPSTDPELPTPHSTGAAIDLTIVDRNGVELPMGCEIDESSSRALPSHHDHRATLEATQYAENRELLRRVMEGAGFHRLSHEWWHFSYGDQFWALIESLRSSEVVSALYGGFRE
jgi:D-alanyl-D-alanine dipeptidase